MLCAPNAWHLRGIPAGNIDAMLKDVEVETLQVNSEGKEVKSNAMSSFWKGYVMALLLSMTTMIYGMNVARSIIQEKTSRIFEVMLATAKPSDMLGGKLIGVGAVGLTQIAHLGHCRRGHRILPGRHGDPLRQPLHPLFLGRRAPLSALFRAGLSALCLAVRRARRKLRDRAGTADVHARSPLFPSG